MNKTELLEELSSHFYKIRDPQVVTANPAEEAINITEKLTPYSVTVYEKQGTKIVRDSVDFNVYDEGTVEEQALYTTEFDKQLFAEKVEIEINNKIVAKQILKGLLSYTNEAMEFAIVDAYTLEADIVSKQKYFVYKENEIIQFKKMN